MQVLRIPGLDDPDVLELSLDIFFLVFVNLDYIQLGLQWEFHSMVEANALASL
jgi:hypothetical protein